MSVNQLIYVSRATMYVDRPELVDIAAKSALNNQARDVTGALLFCNGYFLQILEGEANVIEDLVSKISRDPRHTDVHTVSRIKAATRLFSEWSMTSFHESAMPAELRRRATAWVAKAMELSAAGHLSQDAHELINELRRAVDDEEVLVEAA